MIERDIWSSTQRLIDLYADDATIHAAMRADKLLERDDLDVAAIWRRIIQVLEALENAKSDGKMH